MSDYAHLKRYHQLVGNFCVYFQAKNQLYPGYFGHGYLLCLNEMLKKLVQLGEDVYDLLNKINHVDYFI